MNSAGVAIFRSPRTRSGGDLSRDFTGGYGPEVFTIRRPVPVTCVVKTHYYATHAQKVLGPVTRAAGVPDSFRERCQSSRSGDAPPYRCER